ncbi:MAG: hypothetical protein J3Q66DRAFT_123465 [Benniella sp.]|nr:MAG: hypothetical protein J3Q66DRAFT_123465 [Benniella sp.]
MLAAFCMSSCARLVVMDVVEGTGVLRAKGGKDVRSGCTRWENPATAILPYHERRHFWSPPFTSLQWPVLGAKA